MSYPNWFRVGALVMNKSGKVFTITNIDDFVNVEEEVEEEGMSLTETLIMVWNSTLKIEEFFENFQSADPRDIVKARYGR